MADRVRVLLVEDDPDDYLLIRVWLSDSEGTKFELDWVETYTAALEALARNRHDVCLLDYRLGRHNGLELLREARARGWMGPLILLTGQADRKVDLEALQAGAADYLVKGQINPALLERSIRYALERHQMHAELEVRVRERTAELARANAALAEADRRKDEFLAMLGHELRNPLAPIRNALQLLRLRGSDSNTLTWTQDILDRQIRHMTRLVDDLLDASRIARGKVQLRKERLDLAMLVHSTAEDHRPGLEQAGLALKLDLCPGPVWGEGDPTRLAQVLGNLLANAGKFTDAGGRVTVRLRQEKGSGRAVVSVMDTGIGIERGMLDKVFETFAQADRSIERSRGGLGLGLALVKGLVELHGGGVAVASAGLGHGAEFTFWVPVAVTAVEAARPDYQGDGRATPLRILIVEDNRDAAESLRLLLELRGHQVTLAATGTAGVEAARRLRPEVILCDLGLPGMDGYMVAQTVRADPALGATRLVAVSGYGQDEDRLRCREVGFDAHLTKPIEFADLERLLVRSPGGNGKRA
jgi:signal transduction histidine kinase